jgi:hypothetical protein
MYVDTRVYANILYRIVVIFNFYYGCVVLRCSKHQIHFYLTASDKNFCHVLKNRVGLMGPMKEN